MLFPSGKILRFKGNRAAEELAAAEVELFGRCERVKGCDNELRITQETRFSVVRGPIPPFPAPSAKANGFSFEHVEVCP